MSLGFGNWGFGIWIGFGIWKLKIGIWNLGFGIWNGFWNWDLASGMVWDLGFPDLEFGFSTFDFSICEQLHYYCWLLWAWVNMFPRRARH